MSEQYNGESSTWNYSIQSVGTDESWEANTNFFDVYLFPYFLGIKRCEAGDKGCLNFTLDDSSDSYHTPANNFSRYIFSDGSCFGILTGGSDQSSANMHGWFDYNCNGKPNKSGKDQFYFSLRFSELPEKRLPFSFWNNLTPISNYNREYILQECKKNHESCAALIQYDNWNISDDYPVRL